MLKDTDLNGRMIPKRLESCGLGTFLVKVWARILVLVELVCVCAVVRINYLQEPQVLRNQESFTCSRKLPFTEHRDLFPYLTGPAYMRLV
jgi:hypothetical protein